MAILQMDSFQKTVLASLIGLCVSQSAFALQEISDEGLSQTIGEGIFRVKKRRRRVRTYSIDN